jgi:hypothetical protein
MLLDPINLVVTSFATRIVQRFVHYHFIRIIFTRVHNMDLNIKCPLNIRLRAVNTRARRDLRQLVWRMIRMLHTTVCCGLHT